MTETQRIELSKEEYRLVEMLYKSAADVVTGNSGLGTSELGTSENILKAIAPIVTVSVLHDQRALLESMKQQSDEMTRQSTAMTRLTWAVLIATGLNLIAAVASVIAVLVK